MCSQPLPSAVQGHSTATEKVVSMQCATADPHPKREDPSDQLAHLDARQILRVAVVLLNDNGGVPSEDEVKKATRGTRFRDADSIRVDRKVAKWRL